MGNPHQPVPERRQVSMLQRLSEWASIIALAAIVFGGGAFYQKVDAINEALKEQNGQIVALQLRLAKSEVESERLKGEDMLHRFMLETIMSGGQRPQSAAPSQQTGR